MFRVNHVLAMSRAMGDGYLRPWVSSEPDLALVPVTAEDDFVVGTCAWHGLSVRVDD